MLESVVARLLNRLLGKYVVDLDTENLNVGIFSGKVQLTDLKLKPEALYELKLPIEVKIGTIGKLSLQIPWNYLWSQPVVVNIEDVHIVAGPIVNYGEYDAEKDKRLIRALKRKLMCDLDTENKLIGGPHSFSEYILTNIIDHLQLTLTNLHIKYEDDVSDSHPLACGICVGNITAETTNSKWKPSTTEKNTDTIFYLIKLEAVSAYCNPNYTPAQWNLPAQYYAWRNAMTASLRNYSMNNQNFDFVIKPMTAKIKFTINKSDGANIKNVTSDIIIHDCNLQVSKEQYNSMLALNDSLTRMLISWNFLSSRPRERLSENTRAWWRFAYNALLEQRIRPYTWARIKLIRENYKQYTDIYKKILLNPNDTELKLDLQKYEDRLSIVNIVMARKQARLMIQQAQTTSSSDKSFWSLLPSPERTVLCDKIGFTKAADKRVYIEHKYNLKIGNISLSLTKSAQEIAVFTITQLNITFQPNFVNNTYKMLTKVEGIVVEAANTEDQLIPILSSVHIYNYKNPPCCLKIEVEKYPVNSDISYNCSCILDTVEFAYYKHALEVLKNFIENNYFSLTSVIDLLRNAPKIFCNTLHEKLANRWNINFDIKIPYIIIPEDASSKNSESVLIVDLGRLLGKTDLCRENHISENATQMEIEEQLYSRMHLECSNSQILFCDASDNWHDARKEKDTDLHVLPKTSFNATYAIFVKSSKTVPKHKFNMNFSSIKINISERRLNLLLKFVNKLLDNKMSGISSPYLDEWIKDKIMGKWNIKYLKLVENSVTVINNRLINRKNKSDKNGIVMPKEKRASIEPQQMENLNEAWARCIDLPGLEDNISPNNNIFVLLRFVVNEFSIIFSRSSDCTDRQYLMLRLGLFAMDVALMTYGPAYQVSINSILLTDKLYTNSSGQYLDLVYSPFPSKTDVLSVLYRKVTANCPDFWTHFHGVETSLVADLGTLHLLLHQEAIHTLIKYTHYIFLKIQKQLSEPLKEKFFHCIVWARKSFQSKPETPVPPGAVKFSNSIRVSNVTIRVCDSDFDIIDVQLLELEVDFLFRANERLVFRAYLGAINVEHLSDITLYSKVMYTHEDKVFEVKYVRNASHLFNYNDLSPNHDISAANGNFKFHLGRIHITFLYKLIIQLHRFVVNLEAITFMEHTILLLTKSVKNAIDTFRTTSKIHISINIHGPVLLFPQKSSSPNVIIVDTGELNVENFFKDYTNDLVENILLKVNNITVSRGIMALTSTLEMQETMIEPINFHLDMKRYTSSSKSIQKVPSWDITGVMDVIQITLGQRDLTTVLAVYTENIGEAKIIDLIPVKLKSPSDYEQTDETVRTLEAFFCEPKQKNIAFKFSLDGIKLLLFFDAGELLSSPIRDLNHGLCKLEINEIILSAITYTDLSLDGKLSVDGILIEEMGPDANAHDKRILQSPIDENKNNNCNITVNKPPLIDINFHENKMKDRSVDIIIGKLNLTLSVPFCEKLALFVLECLPKDCKDIGIINHGYVSDANNDHSSLCSISPSLTISLRVNRPEFIFMVETASNKKRYFITRAEILSDFSRHSNRLNLVISLSNLHTLFYELGLHATEPYVVLKQCDIEFSRNCSHEKGEKINISLSSVCIQLCNRVMHSVHDILNDIAEHFKIPEDEHDSVPNKPTAETEVEDLWEPKKLSEFKVRTDNDLGDLKNLSTTHEILLIPKTEIILLFELGDMPVLLLKTTLEMTLYNWSSLINCTCELTLQGNYFNKNVQMWEPCIDPVVLDETEYKAWDVLIKVFQDKSLPILNYTENKAKKNQHKPNKSSEYEPSSEEDSDNNMVYLEPTKVHPNRNHGSIKASLSTFLDDTDSENEDGTMEKLASAISDLFTGDWNESDESDCEHSTDGEEESDENMNSPNLDDGKAEAPENFKKAIYFLIDIKETLNITVTPTFVNLLNEIFTKYSNKTLPVVNIKKSINLINDIESATKVELFENEGAENNEKSTLVCFQTYEQQDSCPNSPKNSGALHDFSEDLLDETDSSTDELTKGDLDMGYDYETTSSLNFPLTTATSLYENINKNHLKIHIPGFSTLQTSCPQTFWEKLIRLQTTNNNYTYYIAAKHMFTNHGRTITVSSPLQICNETCFALSILYQPSVLQQLNLEPVGQVTNPFETTMKISVIEPHESYNVPLYIAHHCKLFMQPTYAEGQFTIKQGLWWQELANELGVAHNYCCVPKDNSMEVFSLKVLLKRNIAVKNSCSHSIPNYVIHLLPPLIFHNYLPCTINIANGELKQQIKLEPGEKSSIYAINLTKDQKFEIKIWYISLIWSGSFHLTSDLEEKVVILSADNKSHGNMKQLLMNLKIDREGSCNIFFYTSYWIVNETKLPLQIKASTTNITYDCTNDNIVIFTYKRNIKQTINLKVYESNWSNDFSVDCAGTTGLIVCKDLERKKRYPILLSVQLSSMCPQLTKIITFLPNFTVTNNTNKFLRFMEHNEKTDLWIDLPPNQSVPFWPETSSMQMYIKYRDSKSTSQAFFTTSTHHTVLRMDKGGAISVNVRGGKTEPFHITFNKYHEGDAPVLVKNLCADVFLKIQQQGQGQVTLLSPFNSLLYTWDDPSKPRYLLWNIYNNKGAGFFLDIFKDGYGEQKINFHSVTVGNSNSVQDISSSEESDSSDSVKTNLNKKVRRDKIIIYWLCYRDGPQKTLLFTQEQRIFNDILNTAFLELCDFEFLTSVTGLSVSIFTSNTSNREHSYLALSDTPASWEVNVGHKWKTLTLELASWIEDKYRLHQKKCQLKDYIHIDFEKMFMLKPFFAELRRSYSPAAYIQYRKSKNLHFFNLKVQSLQIDNKQAESNSIIFQPLSTGNIKSAISFIDFACFKHFCKDYDIYKHIHLQIQPMYLNLDTDFIITLHQLISGKQQSERDSTLLFRNDMARIHSTANLFSKTPTVTTIIENLYLLPMTVQLNISAKNVHNQSQINIFNYFFPSNFSPYIPMEGIHHKIVPIELVEVKGSLLQIWSEVWNHIRSQFLQQYYSQILGIQVLINSYAIQAIPNSDNIPSECVKIANLLLFGCRCLLAHVNMSPAAVEQCIVDIFTNQSVDAIQRIRRHGSYKSTSVPKIIAASYKNFNTGVTLACKQLITTNYNRMQCEGEIFFKGTGKALFSLITRHPDEKSDCVQMAMEALRRAAIIGEPIRIHQRLTRYCNKYLGLKPFSVYESMGNNLLETIANYRFADDTYWAHAVLDKHGKSILIISLEHIIRINKCRLWGSWELEWILNLDEIVSVPKVTDSTLIFNVRQEENKFTTSANKLTVSGDKEVLIWLQEKIEQAIIVSMEDKSWIASEN